MDLLWPDLEGFTAMHTGPPKGGAWVVRAPIAALEHAGYRTDSGAEHPVKDGTVWPPIHIPIPRRLLALSVTPEQLYKQDERRRTWDRENGGVILYIGGERSTPGWYGDAVTHQIERR
jgi:hypothetical protein